MHRPTIRIYEEMAEVYDRNRPPVYGDRARALAVSAVPHLAIADLGCGTGAYISDLRSAGNDVIAVDAAGAMLARVAGGAQRVRADLCALPLARHSLGGAWARNSYLHVEATALPIAFAHLHHAMAVGAPFTMATLGDDFVSTDDLPGRSFFGVASDALAALLEGAGFEDIVVEHSPEKPTWASGRRARTLPDFVGPGMRLLICGLNPSIVSADAGFGYARGTNRFWRAAVEAGIVTHPKNPWLTLVHDRVGMTDLVKRPTVGSKELTRDEYRAGARRVERLVAWLRPKAVCFVGLEGWRAAIDAKAIAGEQPQPFGGAPAYVMPSTSGINAHSRLSDLVGHLRGVYELGSA
jgi:double-stranded uracil-DNA glycosylase